MKRDEAIEILKDMVRIHDRLKELDTKKGCLIGDEYINKRVMALKIAIHSLEVDEKYGLLYMEAADDNLDESDKG